MLLPMVLELADGLGAETADLLLGFSRRPALFETTSRLPIRGSQHFSIETLNAEGGRDREVVDAAFRSGRSRLWSVPENEVKRNFEWETVESFRSKIRLELGEETNETEVILCGGRRDGGPARNERARARKCRD